MEKLWEILRKNGKNMIRNPEKDTLIDSLKMKKRWTSHILWATAKGSLGFSLEPVISPSKKLPKP